MVGGHDPAFGYGSIEPKRRLVVPILFDRPCDKE
jgi:hypothetical protein